LTVVIHQKPEKTLSVFSAFSLFPQKPTFQFFKIQLSSWADCFSFWLAGRNQQRAEANHCVDVSVLLA